MATAFSLSRVPRPSNEPEGPAEIVGPGSYQKPPSLQVSLPGFVPFNVTGKRSENRPSDYNAAPGNYDIATSLVNPHTAGVGSLHSGTQRFAEFNRIDDSVVGPQSYRLPSTIKEGKKKSYVKGSLHKGVQLLEANMRASAPSIPTKFQSTGYESTEDGKLVLQDAVEPGFDGTKQDMVGPGDYEPKIDFTKFRSPPKATMKGSTRDAVYKALEKAGGQAPGPGYYNYIGSFDKFDDSDETNLIVRLNAAKKRLSASFESKTTRNAMLKAALGPTLHHPGPGAYNLRSEEPPIDDYEDPSKPKTNQNFLSGGERFPINKNTINESAPGKYTLKSDFEKNKVNILKKKRLKMRSGWAQNVSFESTERRFFQPRGGKEEIPPPGAYVPTNGDLSKGIRKGNPRAPGFGSSLDRDWEASAKNRDFQTAQEELAKELEQDIRHGIGPGGMSAKGNRGLDEGSRSSKNSGRIAGIRTAFGSAANGPRFSGKSLIPPGPPPGAYNTLPSWGTGGGLAMRQSSVISRKDPNAEKRPGPADYKIPSSIHVPKKNRVNVMVSGARRKSVAEQELGHVHGMPGPGNYAVSGSLLRKSHNILLDPELY